MEKTDNHYSYDFATILRSLAKKAKNLHLRNYCKRDLASNEWMNENKITSSAFHSMPSFSPRFENITILNT